MRELSLKGSQNNKSCKVYAVESKGKNVPLGIQGKRVNTKQN